MIKGIQITQAANDNLLNSFWLLDSEKMKHVAYVQKANSLKTKLLLLAN